MKATAKINVLNVYTGWFQEHDREKCSDCKKGCACQYTSMGEYHKLGHETIKAGEVLTVVYKDADDDTVRLEDKNGLLYDLRTKIYQESFDEAPDN